MVGQTFELLNDEQLELATGGLRISIDVPNPISLVGHVLNGALNVVGGVLEGAGGVLSALGRLLHGGR
jgi:hypothetical protein